MTLLEAITPDRRALLDELQKYKDFLANNPRGERSDFLPFFRRHKQLCAFFATYHNGVRQADSVGYEISLWGDFVCDLVTGSKLDGAFVFVEFEDASKTSLFRAVRGRKVSRWGDRAESGISQVTDWLFRLDSARDSNEIEREFGSRAIRPLGLVVAGRRSEVTAYDARRLAWRSEHTIISGARIAIMTYDDLLDWLDGRVALLKGLEEAPEV
jgi:hypothetical protein